jgi:ABC-type Fe3+/spermidine/putrescine transport system ATPase subunit
MLDEPLGSLDAALKARLLIDLPGVIRALGLTAVYVTHDQSEALAIADRIVLMNEGAIVQIDTPAALYRRPASTFAARFLGLNNLIPVVSRTGHSVHTSIGEFEVAGAGDTLLIHPDGLTINSAGTGRLEGTIHQRVFHGAWVEVQVRCGEVILTLRMPLFGPEVPAVGEGVTLDVAREAAILIAQSDA